MRRHRPQAARGARLAPENQRGAATSAIAREVAALLQRKETGPTFQEMAEAFFRTDGRRLENPENQRRHLAHMRPLWELREEELTPRVIEGLFADLLRPAGPLGPATINKLRSTGRKVIRSAQKGRDWKGINPFDPVDRHREPEPEHRTFTREEAMKLLPHLRADRRREAQTMLYLGLRPGELKGLHKVDVDLERRELDVRRSNDRPTTKTGKRRRVPIPDELLPVLREAIEVSPRSCPLVFPAEGGELQRSDAKLSRTLRTAMGKAGIVRGWRYTCRRKGCGHSDEQAALEQRWCPTCGFKLWPVGVVDPVRWYDLRHSAATLHHQAGCDPLVIQVVLGHAPESLTDSRYTHLTQGYMRAELNRLSLKEGPCTPPDGGVPPPVTYGGNTMGSLQSNPRPVFRGGSSAGRARASQASGRGFPEPLLTVAEVAKLLRVSTAHVYGMIERGALRAIRLGAIYRIAPDALRDLVSGGVA